MSEHLSVGFYSFTPYPAAGPGLAGAAAIPAVGIYTGMVGGPRTLQRIKDEIAACERHLTWLKSEMSGHPDYRHADQTEAKP